MRLRAAGGSVGSRVRRTGFFLLGRSSKDRRSGTQSTIEVDHAESAHQAEFRILDRPRSGLARELADRSDHAENPARGARLADGQLAAAGIERKAAVVRE